MNLKVNVPGHGPVLMEVGRIVAKDDWSEIYVVSGSRHVLNDGTFEDVLCGYFE